MLSEVCIIGNSYQTSDSVVKKSDAISLLCSVVKNLSSSVVLVLYGKLSP